jgi:hypothetical protein
MQHAAATILIFRELLGASFAVAAYPTRNDLGSTYSPYCIDPVYFSHPSIYERKSTVEKTLTWLSSN